jgi:hypothetical protein
VLSHRPDVTGLRGRILGYWWDDVGTLVVTGIGKEVVDFPVVETRQAQNSGATASTPTRNADDTVRSTGGFTEVTSASATERRMRFALKILF